MFPQIFGKYVLEREMARGGMARVFLATLRGAGGFEKRLVVKQIRPELASDDEFVRRFVAEAKTAVSLSHPNIVPVYELGVEQGIYYIAMELCEGVTLAELLQHQTTVSAAEGAYLGVEVCRALDYAHRRSVVHRDVTPGNVMVDAEGAVRLIDFGIAASVIQSSHGGQIFGSLGHMSPEQLAGEHAGPVSDVFAVGTVLIEAWTGKAPFRRDTLEQTREALAVAPAPLSESNAQLKPLDDLLRSAIEAEESQRPPSAEEFSRPLRDFLKSTDMGDVARKLGQTVGQILAQRESAPPTAAEVVDDAPESPKTDGNTRTFAAQLVLAEWTRPLSASNDDGGPRTTKVAPALRKTRRLTRILVSTLLGTAALEVLRFCFPSHPTDSIKLQPAEPIGVVAVRAPAPPAPPAPQIRTERAVMPAEVGGAPTLLPSERHAAASAEPVAKAPQGELTLSAEPPCQVFIDGKLKGRTPLRALPLPLGGHQVEFVSDVTDERLSTRIDVRLGQRPQLHADFTAATPRLVLH